MTDRELMKQELEALEVALKKNIADLRERLAQPEKVMAEYKFQTYAAYKTDGEMKIGVVPTTRPATREEKIVRPGVYEVTGPLHVVCKCDKCKAQPEQEPVAWMQEMPTKGDETRSVRLTTVEALAREEWASPIPLYTTPPRREWVGLTGEEIGLLTTGDGWSHLETPALALFARAIEAKLKEKNA